MQNSLPLRVLVVDDHEVVREGLRHTLAADERVEVVGVAGTGREAITRCQRLRPEVALVDFRLPDITGDEVCRRMLQVAPRTLVMLLTSYATADRVRAAVEAGAFGYVTKADGLSAIRVALEQAIAVRDGDLRDDPTPAARYLLDVLQRDARRRTDDRLTPHQQRVLELAVEGHTDREIGEALCVSESTVRYHLQRVKARLGVRSKLDLVRRAYADGLLGGPSSDPFTPDPEAAS